MSTTFHPRTRLAEQSAGPVKPAAAAKSAAPRRALGEISASAQNSKATTIIKQGANKSSSNMAPPLKPTQLQPTKLTTTIKPASSSSTRQQPPPMKLAQPKPINTSNLPTPSVLALPSFDSLEDPLDTWEPVELSKGNGIMSDFFDSDIDVGSKLLLANGPQGSQVFSLQRPKSPIMWQRQLNTGGDTSSSNDAAATAQDELLAAQLNAPFDFEGIDDFDIQF